MAILERRGERPESYTYGVRHLERFAPGTPDAEVRRWLDEVFAEPPLRDSNLTIDCTGVGKHVVDLLRRKLTARVNRVTVTAGLAPSHDGGSSLVPRKELVGLLQVLLQSRRLKVAPALEHATLLVRELANFKARIVLNAPDDAVSWREGRDDDLVLAVVIAA